MLKWPAYPLIGALLATQLMGACCCVLDSLFDNDARPACHGCVASAHHSSGPQCDCPGAPHEHTQITTILRQSDDDTPLDLALPKTPAQHFSLTLLPTHPPIHMQPFPPSPPNDQPLPLLI